MRTMDAMEFEPLPPLGHEDYAPRFAAWSAGDPCSAGVEELATRVFRLPLVAPAACARLLAEAGRRAASARAGGTRPQPPNSMHEHGLALAELGFAPLLDALHARVAPLAQALLPEFAGAGLDSHHSYLVDYSRDTDEDLGFHVDDSEITVNICLGDEFRGAELVMMGLRCDLHRQDSVRREEEIEIAHSVGWAVLHAGRHRHRVEPVRGGRRRNLIMWSRSSTLRSAPPPLACATWCGRRTP